MTLDLPTAPSLLGHETEVKRALPIAPPGTGSSEPAYYDIPFLKKPVWTWEIGAYFFLGGLSAGSYVLARLAERAGGPTYRSLTRTGTFVALAAIAPCPILLIADLGDPSRFHHMLRVFKPRSPMSLGSWTLAGYSGVVFLSALREWYRDDSRRPGRISRIGITLLDAAGLPLALLFSGYTGVLLSGTATPVWTQNAWLGPLFCAGALANGAAAISLAAEATQDSQTSESIKTALQPIETAAHLTEAATLAGAMNTAGPLSEPLLRGPAAPFFWAAVAGLAAAEVLRHLPAPAPAKSLARTASSVLDIASGFCLKWAIFRAGVPSAVDPHANRRSSRPR